jgi:hypothetical protein
MPKTVLVICSRPTGSDFPREENQTMLKTILGDEFVPEFLGESSNYPGRYPRNLPTGKKFDAILFAGCNVLIWLFGEDGNHETGIKNLSSLLNDDGVIIFVETKKYVETYGGEGHYDAHSLSIPIESIKLLTTQLDDETGLKGNIINTWKKYFTQTHADKYIVYKKVKEGGKRKRRSITRRKRKTRYSK